MYVTSSGIIRYDNRSYAVVVQRKICARQQISAPSVPSCVHANNLSNCDGDVAMLEHVFINLNLCCIQCYKFHVCIGKEDSRDTVTQIYQCAPKS